MIVSTTNRPQDPAGTVLHVAGEVDTFAADHLREHLYRLGAEPDGAVVVDLSDVTFISCTALGVLAEARGRLGSRLLLGGRSRIVGRLLDITGLSSYFPGPTAVGDGEAAPEGTADGATGSAAPTRETHDGTWTFSRGDVRRVRDRLVAVHGCDADQAWRMLTLAAARHGVPVGEVVELLLGARRSPGTAPSTAAAAAALTLLMREPAGDRRVVGLAST